MLQLLHHVLKVDPVPILPRDTNFRKARALAAARLHSDAPNARRPCHPKAHLQPSGCTSRLLLCACSFIFSRGRGGGL
jgi:hypothetical protein